MKQPRDGIGRHAAHRAFRALAPTKAIAGSSPAEATVADRHVLRLYRAVANYVKQAGGEVLVAGGIQIIQWPVDGKFRFTVGVKCTGRKPIFSEEKK